MSPRIGFTLVTHDKPAQFLRLTRRLSELFPDAPIACHHDFSKTPLNGLEFPACVQFVRPYLVTQWGQFSVVLAFRAALRLLYSWPDPPDWFVSLGGSDYPVRAPADVLRDLETGGADAYLVHELVQYPSRPDPKVEQTAQEIASREWCSMIYGRYIATRLWLPGFSVSRRKPVKIRIVRPPWKIMERWLTPFGSNFRCYTGEFCIAANRRAAEALLADSPANRKLDRHFKKRPNPDEALIHTVLCNHPGLRVSPANLRYIDWSTEGPHPKLLAMEDLPRIFASGAHFARKFDWESGQPVLDAIDAQVDRAVAAQPVR